MRAAAGIRNQRRTQMGAAAVVVATGVMLVIGGCAGPGAQQVAPMPQVTFTLEDPSPAAPPPLESLPEVEGGGTAPEPVPRSRYDRRRGGSGDAIPPVSPLEQEARLRSQVHQLEAERQVLDRRLERFDQGGDGSSRRQSLSYGPGNTRHDELIDRRLDLERRALEQQRRQAQERLDRQIYDNTVYGRPDSEQSPLERQLERLRQGPGR